MSETTASVSPPLVSDALAVSARWLAELDLVSLTTERLDLTKLNRLDSTVDVVAIGKAAREMAGAARVVLGERLGRQLIVSGTTNDPSHDHSTNVFVGEHPIPGEGSLRSGAALLTFLEEPTSAECTLFLLSGGASSLCVVPQVPLTLDDLRGIWDAALSAGIDITALNMIRASGSAIAGGAVLRHVRTAYSQSLILVDNVISGAKWVASGLTYDFRPSREDVTALLAPIGLGTTSLAQRTLDASRRRDRLVAQPVVTLHENVVLAEPSMMLTCAIGEARRRGYRVVDMGAHVRGDVVDVSDEWANVLARESSSKGPVCVVGVGEVTVQVRGSGTGGRCQEFAWLMARALASRRRDVVFVARASDGRDFVDGVGGAWVDATSEARARSMGIEWSAVAEANDSHAALSSLGALIEGEHTGWNLCDLYVALM